MTTKLEQYLATIRKQETDQLSSPRTESAAESKPMKNSVAAINWRMRVWGDLPSITSDDPNFQPTHPLPSKISKQNLGISKISAFDAEKLVNKKLEGDE